MITAAVANTKKRKLPDWFFNPAEEPSSSSSPSDTIITANMLDNTREAIRILEEDEWKKDWGDWDLENKENVLFDLEQSSVMDYMAVEDVLEIICRARGIAYTASSYPFMDDREALVNDLRQCLAKVSAECQIPYYE